MAQKNASSDKNTMTNLRKSGGPGPELKEECSLGNRPQMARKIPKMAQIVPGWPTNLPGGPECRPGTRENLVGCEGGTLCSSKCHLCWFWHPAHRVWETVFRICDWVG